MEKVNIQSDDKIKHKVGSAYVIQIAERIEESTQKMKWKTSVDVAKVLPPFWLKREREVFNRCRVYGLWWKIFCRLWCSGVGG